MPTLKSSIFATTLLLAVLNAMAGPGMIDTSYAPGVSGGPVYAEAIQPDGRLVIGGEFYSVGGSTRYHIARLFANGALDTSFQNGLAGASSTVKCLTVQTDGRIVMGGTFTSVNGTLQYGVARLNSNGAVDGSFVPGSYSYVNALAVQSDNKVIIGGGSQTGYVYRLNADGSLETTFTNYSSGPSGPIYAVAIQSDGKIIIGGSFTSFNGTSRYNIARLNTDGSLDTSFLYGLTGASSAVRCLQVQADGKILIGGDFNSVNGTSRGHFARLTSTGTLDTGFNSTPGVNGPVYALALQSDSSVLVAGSFSYYVGSGSYYNNLARFYPDGTIDTNFYSNFSAPVYSLAVQSDGGILAGGSFTVFGQKSQPYLARVYGNLYPPEFITQPTNRVANVGTNVTFSALVSNPTLTYFQWRKNGSDIPGATGVSYSLYNVQIGDAGTYSVFANNAIGGVTSSNAVLQVGIAPAITQQPVSLTVTQGQAATFTIGASGTPLNYFWKKNGTFIPGATNASLTFANVVFTNAATYTCQVSNFLGNVTSAGAVLTVYAPPTILVQPANKTVGVSSNFIVSVTANGTPPLFYQWLKDSALLTDFTNASFTITNAQTTDSGGYFVVITNSIGRITSSVATVSIIYYPPTIATQPVGGTFLVGSNFTLSVTPGGSAPFGYQWNTNDVPISGANAASYSVSNAQTNDSGAYTVIVTNLGGSVTSSVALVNVGYAPVILQQLLPFTNSIGTSNAFGVSVFGSDPLLYQWFKDGAAIPNATNSQLLLPSLQSNQIGYYSVTVTNIYGWAVSSNAFLSISNVALPFQWVGLLAYYPFNGDANDASGNGNNGTVVGATFQTYGAASKLALQFNGNISSYVFVPRSTSLEPVDAISISMWVKGVPGQPCGQGWGTILRKADDCQPGYFIKGCNGGTSFQLCGANPCGGEYWNAGFLPFTGTSWQHIVGTYSRTDGSMKSYEDGVLVNQTPLASQLLHTGNLYIGGAAVVGDDGGFKGLINEVRIYNRALSSNEVAQLYAFEADLPVITSQPQSQTVVQGGSVTFSVNATAANPLAYQWFKDGTALNDSTNATLVLTNVQSGLAGNFTVAVSNALVGVVSSPAVLTVISPITNSAPSYASNQFGFNISGTAGNSFVVEVSTNLQTWLPLVTNTFGTNAFQFIDPGSATNPLRFYRTRY